MEMKYIPYSSIKEPLSLHVNLLHAPHHQSCWI